MRRLWATGKVRLTIIIDRFPNYLFIFNILKQIPKSDISVGKQFNHKHYFEIKLLALTLLFTEQRREENCKTRPRYLVSHRDKRTRVVSLNAR